MKEALKFFVPLFLGMISISIFVDDKISGTVWSLVFFIVYVTLYTRFTKGNESPKKNDPETDTGTEKDLSTRSNIPKTPYFVYYGDELGLSDVDVTAILTKRFPYYNSLSPDQQPVFIERLQKFIREKTFKVHDNSVFKEMPVLISATAIQLTFGLKKYLLPYFEFIHIYPEEFIRTQPVICFLEGNVSGHAINLSWKHYLEGYANPNDGQNVGLHELSHALYYQTFVVGENVDKNFRNQYDEFMADGNKVYHTEKTVPGGRIRNTLKKICRNSGAESVELFFERPSDMSRTYPRLYDAMKSLLNQDPLNNSSMAR